jgi:hypothetical protein
MEVPRSRLWIALLAGAALLAVAIPVLAASPTPSASPSTSPVASVSPSPAATSPSASAGASLVPVKPDVTAEPDVSARPEATAEPAETAEPDEVAKPDKTEKPDKGPETSISIKGTIDKAADGKGRPTYSMTVDGKTWELSAGPPWFWGDMNPLNAFVGKSVMVVGTTRTGDAEIDVETVDGTALRAPGKPPWAGGPWVVGSTHPGYKDWMANGKPGKGLGRESAPGQLKKASPAS